MTITRFQRNRSDLQAWPRRLALVFITATVACTGCLHVYSGHVWNRRLLHAVHVGDSAEATEALQHGADPDCDRGYALLSAIERGHEDIARLLITHGSNVSRLRRWGTRDTTPLIKSVSVGLTNIVELLLCKGADVNQPNSIATPLEYAITWDQKGIAAILQQHGALDPRDLPIALWLSGDLSREVRFLRVTVNGCRLFEGVPAEGWIGHRVQSLSGAGKTSVLFRMVTDTEPEGYSAIVGLNDDGSLRLSITNGLFVLLDDQNQRRKRNGLGFPLKRPLVGNVN